MADEALKSGEVLSVDGVNAMEAYRVEAQKVTNFLKGLGTQIGLGLGMMGTRRGK